MTTTRKALLATLAGAALLAGCATGPYYDGYGYDRYGYGGPAYYGDPGYYVGPSIGLGLTYSDRDYRRREWRGDHRDRDWRRDDRRDDRRDYDGRNRGRDDSPSGPSTGPNDPYYSPS